MRGEITVNFSDEKINAYADNELQGQEKNAFETALKNSPELQLALNDTYALKKQIRETYKNIQTVNTTKNKTTYMQLGAYAAILLLTFSGGWISSDLLHTTHEQQNLTHTTTINNSKIKHQQGKYIIHIGRRDDKKFRQTLHQVDTLLAQNKNNMSQLQLEIIANAGGLDLLRTNATPYTERIKQLIANYPNVTFIACANAIDRLQEQNKTLDLINAVQHGPATAIDQVIRRVNEGWTYIKI